MIQKLLSRPVFYLDVAICEDIYNQFRLLTEFEEQLPPFDSRYPSQLESVLGSISQTFDGENLFPTVLDASSAYFSKIACGHVFANGNKRLGIVITHTFLLIHKIDFNISNTDLYFITEELAAQTQKGVPKSEVDMKVKKIIQDLTIELTS